MMRWIFLSEGKGTVGDFPVEESQPNTEGMKERKIIIKVTVITVQAVS